jgi:hypothetical protein
VAINFPTSLDNFTNPSSGNTLDSPSHSLQHSDINDAVEALEAKLGIGASPAGSATSGQVLTASTGGTTTWSTPTTPGLTQIVPSSVAVGSGSGSVSANGVVTVTGASTVSINDVFSNTYERYKIIASVTGSTTQTQLLFRLRVGGSDNSSTNYREQFFTGDGSTASAGRDTGRTSWEIGTIISGYKNYLETDIGLPFQSFNTMGLTRVSDAITGNIRVFFGGLGLDVTTSYTGFTLIANSGTMSGTISIYAYR